MVTTALNATAKESCSSLAIRNVNAVAAINFEPKNIKKAVTKVVNADEKAGVYSVEARDSSEEPLVCLYTLKMSSNILGDCSMDSIKLTECSQ